MAVNFAQIASLAKISPLKVLQQSGTVLRPSPASTLALALGAFLFMFLFALSRANSWVIASGFSLSLTAACLMVVVLIVAALKVLESTVLGLGTGGFFLLRHGILQLVRKKRSTFVFLFSLSLGFSLLGALNVVRHSLANKLALSQSLDIPDLFLIDIQKNQRHSVRRIMQKYAKVKGRLAPLIRARMTHINGVKIIRRKPSSLSLEEKTSQRFLVREQNLTYKDHLQASEKIVAGNFWQPGELQAQVSIEKWFSEQTGIRLGDLVRLDIQGRPFEAKVTSLRSVEWSSARPNFFYGFSQGFLRAGPRDLRGLGWNKG